jgi:uncharacterized protein YjbI with pentapeptide repeats
MERILKFVSNRISITIYVLLTLTYLIRKGYLVDWTGFKDFTPPNPDYVQAKTLWDWMDLLLIPFILALAAYVLNRSERQAERERAEETAKLERKIATDRQQELALQTYLDKMTDLLLREKLRTSMNNEARNMATIRTITLLRGLDANRRKFVLLFLKGSGLINLNPIIDLQGADLSDIDTESADLSAAKLSGVNLDRSNLSKANLERADLSNTQLVAAQLNGAHLNRASLLGANIHRGSLQEAQLREANLKGINLSSADLSGANLLGAMLNDADFTSANLSGADLTGASLNGANLIRANLHGADLTGASLNNADLTEANLYGARMYGAILNGAQLRRTNLMFAEVTAERLAAASWDEESFEIENPNQITVSILFGLIRRSF